VIGALAGYPLIKHCMNQGYDVIEFLNGNTDLKPADEPILVIFVRNDPGSSMFAIAEGSVAVEVNPDDPSVTVPIEQGTIFGEVGLISGRKRGATIRAAKPTTVIELSRGAALKLIATVPSAGRAVNRITIERQLLQMFGSGLSKEDVAELVEAAEIVEVPSGKVVTRWFLFWRNGGGRWLRPHGHCESRDQGRGGPLPRRSLHRIDAQETGSARTHT